MKKVSLLFLAASLSASAFAINEVYIIKDGKLQPGVSYSQWTDPNDGLSTPNVTEKDGYVEIDHQRQYGDVRFDIDQTVLKFNLMEKNIVVEYQLPESAMLYSEDLAANLEDKTAVGKDKPTMMVRATADTLSAATWDGTKTSPFISHANIDGKFNPEAAKGFIKYEASAMAKSEKTIGAIFVAYLRENGWSPNCPAVKIKNLYYYEPEFKTFFSCAFDGTDTWTETHQIANGDDWFMNKGFYQYPVSIIGDPDYEYIAEVKMLYQNGLDNWTGSDHEGGFLSSELYHGLLVKSPKTYADEFNGVDKVLAFKDVALPAEQCSKVRVRCVVTADPGVKTLTGDKSEQIPMFIQFDNGEEIQLFQDSIINGIYTLEQDEVSIPAGAKTVSVLFKAHPTITYIVDDLVLTADYTDSVAEVEGDGASLSIYPNPVVDAISFAGVESVESVEIISMNGASVPCAVVNGSVNVSNLAAGEYVVIVNKTISGKFIKK